MNWLRTKLTQLTGARYPIVQAPIGSATTAELAAAVSNAGALGSVSITWRSLEDARALIRCTAALSPYPVAVNVVLAWPQEQRIHVALHAGARILWTFWGDPTPFVETVHAAGALLVHTVGAVDEGERAAAAGVDLIVAQGVEAGGHVRGTQPWRALLADLIPRLPHTPVLVAGGMADGGDLVSALAAGAAGACFGTRFICSTEANAAKPYQDAVLSASEGDTLLTGLFDKGWPAAPHRVLRNTTVRLWEAAGSPPPGVRPGEHDQVAFARDGSPIERYSDVIPTQELSGDLEALALYAGESSARVRAVLPAAAIVTELVDQALRTLNAT